MSRLWNGRVCPLTTNADVLTPNTPTAANKTTAGGDTIFGLTQNSLSSADIIDGGAGTDTLIADFDIPGGDATTTITPVLSNVESVTLRNTGTTADGGETLVFNASQTTGMTSLTFDDITAKTAAITATASSLTTAVATLGVSNNDVSAHVYNFNYSAATGTADAVTLNVANNGTPTGIITIKDDTSTATADTGFETVTVNSTVGTSTLADVVVSDSAGDSVNTFKFTGDKNLTITNSLGFEGTTSGAIDASGFTAGTLTLTATDGEAITFTGGAGKANLTTGAGNDVITGGAGDEVFTIGAGDDRVDAGAGNDDVVLGNISDLTSADSIKMGDGAEDRVTIGTITTLNAAAVNATQLGLLNAITGNEGLELAVNNATAIDANYFSTNNFYINNTSTDIAISDVETGDSFTFLADLTGATGDEAVTFDGVLPGQSVTINLGGGIDIAGNNTAATDTAFDFNSNIGTVTINSTGTTANTITGANAGAVAITNGSATNFVVTGSQDLTINGGTTSNNGFSTGISLSATAFTGKLTIEGSSEADIIVGGSGDDVIDGGSGGADQITTGAGADDVILRTGAADTITGFTAGTDDLDVQNGGVLGGLTKAAVAAGAGNGVTLTNDNAYVVSTNGQAANLTTGGTATITEADLTAGTLTNLAAYLDERFVASTNNTDDAVIALNWTASGSTKSYVYEYVEANTSNTIQAAELSLIGIVERGSTLLTVDDII